MPILLLIEIHCRWCGLVFDVCRSCYRGHAYCSDECRVAGKRKSHRKAQRKYRRTTKGKKQHCEAENRRRYRSDEKNHQSIRKMDDAATIVLSEWCMGLLVGVRNRLFHVQASPKCHFCGSYGHLVDEFPRRGYG